MRCVAHHTMKLRVHVHGKPIAELFSVQGDYLLRYLPAAGADDFVALTMPVRERPWIWPRELHPFFLQHLPNEALSAIARSRFDPAIDNTAPSTNRFADLALLGVVEAKGIGGRVVITVADDDEEHLAPDNTVTAADVEQLLDAEDAAERFGEIVGACFAGAAGSLGSSFSSDEARLSQVAPDAIDGASAAGGIRLGHASLRTGRHVIKVSGIDTPFRGFNEYYSMRVMARLNVAEVANVRMSRDGKVLVADRFDIDAHGGVPHGLEDAASLLGLPPAGKYRPSLQQVLDATESYIEPSKREAQRAHVGWQLLVNCILQNADWHAKHIALRYTNATDAAYAPIYDVITTAAYAHLGRQSPGLSVDGRTNPPTGKILQRFFKTRLGITPPRYAEMVECICESVIEVRHEIVMAARNEPKWRDLARSMVHVWDDGMARLWHPKRSIRRSIPVERK